jgi:hypothetical protein
MMEVVTFVNIVESFKRAFHEVLAMYFDGNTHKLNDQILTFPNLIDNGQIVYDARFLTDAPPLPLTVSIIGRQAIRDHEIKNANPQKPNDPGVELRADIVRHVFVTGRLQDDDSLQTRKLIDEVYGLLFAVIKADHVSFGQRGILFPTLSSIPEDTSPSQHIAQAYGVLRCTVRSVYARHNTT